MNHLFKPLFMLFLHSNHVKPFTLIYIAFYAASLVRAFYRRHAIRLTLLHFYPLQSLYLSSSTSQFFPSPSVSLISSSALYSTRSSLFLPHFSPFSSHFYLPAPVLPPCPPSLSPFSCNSLPAILRCSPSLFLSSQTLAWLQVELPKHGFSFRTLLGSMTMAHRAKALADFQVRNCFAHILTCVIRFL